MTTVRQAVSIIGKISHFPESQIRAMSRYLIDEDMLPKSSGRDIKKISEEQFILLLIACYVSKPGKSSPEEALEYFDLYNEELSEYAGNVFSNILKDFIRSGNNNAQTNCGSIQINTSEKIIDFHHKKGFIRFGKKAGGRKPSMVVEFSRETLEDIASLWRESSLSD